MLLACFEAMERRVEGTRNAPLAALVHRSSCATAMIHFAVSVSKLDEKNGVKNRVNNREKWGENTSLVFSFCSGLSFYGSR